MFTYLNSEGTRLFFNVELLKVKLNKPREQKTSLDIRSVNLVVGQPGKPEHEIELGLYVFKKGLLEGISSVDVWARDKNYITLEMLRKRLRECYDSPMIEAKVEAVPQ